MKLKSHLKIMNVRNKPFLIAPLFYLSPLLSSCAAVRSLVTNPPDDSTLLGRPITYSIAAATPQEPVDPQPHVLVVENLPPVDDIDEDFKSFMNETTRFSITSCQIKDGKGYLQFDNPEGMQALYSFLHLL